MNPCRPCREANITCLVPPFVLVRDTRSAAPNVDFWRRPNCINCTSAVCPGSTASRRRVYATTPGPKPAPVDVDKSGPAYTLMIERASAQQQTDDHGRAGGGRDDPVDLASPPPPGATRRTHRVDAGEGDEGEIVVLSSPPPLEEQAAELDAPQRPSTPDNGKGKHGAGTPLSARLGSWARQLRKRGRSKERSGSPSAQRHRANSDDRTDTRPASSASVVPAAPGLTRPQSTSSLMSSTSFVQTLNFGTQGGSDTGSSLPAHSLPTRTSGPGGSLGATKKKTLPQRPGLDVFGLVVKPRSTIPAAQNRLRSQMADLEKNKMSTKPEADEDELGTRGLTIEDLQHEASPAPSSGHGSLSALSEVPPDDRERGPAGYTVSGAGTATRMRTVRWRTFRFESNPLPDEALTVWPNELQDACMFDDHAGASAQEFRQSVEQSQEFFRAHWQGLCDGHWRGRFDSEAVRGEMRAEAHQQAEAMRSWLAYLKQQSEAMGMRLKYDFIDFS